MNITGRTDAEVVAAHLAAIVTSSEDAIISKNLKGIILSWNHGAERIFGYTAEEMIGQTIHRLIPSHRHDEEAQIISRISKGERLEHYETVRQRKDGRLIDISLTVSPIKDTQGHIIGASKIARDITQQKIRESQQQRMFEFATSVNRAEALTDLYEKAIDAVIESLRANRAAILLLESDGIMHFKACRGLSSDYLHAVEGHSPWHKDDPTPRQIVLPNIAEAELAPHFKTTVLHEGIQAVAAIPLSISRHVIGKLMVYFDQPHALPDGDIRVAQAIANTLAFGIERKRAEEALRESEMRQGAIVDSALDCLITMDHEGRIVEFNPAAAKTFGHRPEDVIGRTVAETIIPPQFREAHWKGMERYLRTGEEQVMGRRLEMTAIRADGTEFPVELSITAVCLPERPPFFTAFLRDITERRNVMESLREAQDKLQRWSQELEQRVAERTKELEHSHERLRALATELNLAEQRERKRIAVELHDHLQQLLVIGKLQLGQGTRLPKATPACVKVMEATDEVLTQALNYTRTLVAELSPPVLLEHGLPAGLKWLGEQMRHHQLIVAVDCMSDELNIPQDQAVLLFQSVRELLINAAKHAKSKGATVRMTQENQALRIEVQDQGTGFDPLATASPDTSTAHSSKFGLFSIRERMTALGGTFEIQSAPGEGTTAILELPRAEVAEALHTSSARATTGLSAFLAASGLPSTDHGAGLGHPRIVRVLLVDDHAMMLQGLRSVLSVYSDVQIVGEAQDGEEAIALVHNLRPSVVVMDINMPKLNGIEATTYIKSHYPEIKVIGLSVNAGRENQEAMMQAGATSLITKEAAVDQLYRAIQEVMVDNWQ